MLSSFFKKAGQPPATQQTNATVKVPSPPALDLDPEIEELPPPSSSQAARTSSPPPPSDSQQARPPKRKEPTSNSTSQTSKPSATTRSTKKQKLVTKSGQTMLSSFFPKPSNKSETKSKQPQPSDEVIELELDDDPLTPTQQSSTRSQSDDLEQLESDFELSGLLDSFSQKTQTSLSNLSNRTGSSSQSKSSSKPTAASWSEIMAPLVAPLCTVHWESTKELTVNKPGPNKGRKFYVCSRFAVTWSSILNIR